jgi:hypothetical protein
MQTLGTGLRAAGTLWNEVVLRRPGRSLAWILVAAAGFMLFSLNAEDEEASDQPGPPEARRSHGTPAGVDATTAALGAAADRMPLYFVENGGRFPGEVAYVVEGGRTSVFFTPGGLTMTLREPRDASAKAPGRTGIRRTALASGAGAGDVCPAAGP